MVHSLVLRPDADVLFPSGWTTTSGTLFAALADGSLASPTHATYVGNAFNFAIAMVRLADPVDATYLAQDVAVLDVQISGFWALLTGGVSSSMRAYLQLGGKADPYADDFRPISTNYQRGDGRKRTSDPYGRAWTKAAVASLAVGFYENNLAQTLMSTLAVTVRYVLPPVTATIGPTGTVGTANPTITWERSHDEGLAQSAYEVKIFDAAVYQRGDFDPAKSLPVTVTSGETTGSELAWDVAASLTNGTSYKAAVRTAVTAGGRRLWSPWVVGGVFTVSFETPAVPAMVIEPQPDAGRVRVNLQGLDNLLTTNEADFEREASTDTWAKVTSTMTVARTSAVAEHGTWAMSFVKGTSTGDMTAGTTNLQLAYPGEVFSARARFRCAGAAKNARLTITAYDALGAVISSQNGTSTAGSTSAWTTLTCDGFTLPALTAYVALSITVIAALTTDTHYFDSIWLGRGATAPSWSRGGLWTRNLLLADDSDFETTIGSWVATGTNTTVARSTTIGGHHGTAAMRLTAGAAVAGVAAMSGLYAVRPGEGYLLMGSVQPGAGSADAALGVEYFDGNLASLGVEMGAATAVSAGSWTDLFMGDTAPEGAAYAALYVSFDGALGNGTHWYADAMSIANFNAGVAFSWSRGQDSAISTWFVVEASDDAGATWFPIRNGDRIVPDVFQKAVIYDYEVPPLVARRYRARTEANDPTVAPAPSKIASVNTAEQTAAIPTRRWWFKSLTDPLGSMGFGENLVVRKGSVTRSMDERVGRFVGIGSSLPVFVSDSVGGEDGALTVRVYGNAAWAQFKAIIADPAPVLLVDPIAQEQWYVKLTARRWDEETIGSGPVRNVTLDYEETARP